MKYRNSKILSAERGKAGKFEYTNQQGVRETVTTPPLIAVSEINNCAHTVILVTENAIYACEREEV